MYSIVSKIKKLLALAKSPYPEEAQSALVKAKKLLADHDLSMEHVETAEVEEQGLEHNHVVSPYAGDVPDWVSYLAYVVSENFGCVYYIHDRHKVTVLGRPEASRAAREAFFFAVRAAEECFTQFATRSELTFGVVPRKEAYMLGFVTGLKNRFSEEARSIVVRTPKEAIDFIEENTQKVEMRAERPRTRAELYSAYRGNSDGKKVRPNQLR